MHGGNGQSVARGPHLAPIFSWRGEEDYLHGRSPRLSSTLRPALRASGQVLAVLAVFTVVIGASLDGLGAIGFLVMAGLFALLVPGAMIAYGLMGERQRREMERGALLVGHVLWSRGEIVRRSGAGSAQRSDAYLVTVAWRLRLPDGQVIERQTSIDRWELRGHPLPGVGAPIAVLARSPAEVMVL